MQFLLPFCWFAIITLLFAMIDFSFLESLPSQNFVWRYPSKNANLLGALWFGEVCAAILTPLVVRYLFKFRHPKILLPWLVLGGVTMLHLAINLIAFFQAPFSPFEALWRSFHMPMASLHQMTFAVTRDYFSSFIFLQGLLVALFVAGYLIAAVFDRNHRHEN